MGCFGQFCDIRIKRAAILMENGGTCCLLVPGIGRANARQSFRIGSGVRTRQSSIKGVFWCVGWGLRAKVCEWCYDGPVVKWWWCWASTAGIARLASGKPAVWGWSPSCGVGLSLGWTQWFASRRGLVMAGLGAPVAIYEAARASLSLQQFGSP